MILSLVVGGQRGQRGHHIRYAHSKASELHLNLGLNFIDIFVLKAFFFCILFSFGLILVRWNMQFRKNIQSNPCLALVLVLLVVDVEPTKD